MKNVLMVTYYFPPMGGVGTMRTVKFVKYLQKHGWLPLILTVNKRWGERGDESLQRDIPSNVKIYRTPSPELSRSLPWRVRNLIESLIFFPDNKMGWIPFALSSARRIIKNEKIDLIYSSSAPYTSHIVGLLLKKTLNRPWVADFRDPWIDNFTYQPLTKFHKIIDEKLEREVVKNADRVISSTESYSEQFINKYPYERPEKFITITNGYDEDDFNDLPVRMDQGKCRIVYVGSFYSGQSPEKFLSAVKILIKENPDLISEIEIIFVGNIYKPVVKMCKQMKLNDVVKVFCHVDHKESIEYMASADALLLLLNPAGAGCFPAKIFEYIRSGKPIIGLVPEGESKKLLHSTRTGIAVDPENVGAIKNALLSIYKAKKNGKLTIDPNWEEIKKYERAKQAKVLCACFDQLI